MSRELVVHGEEVRETPQMKRSRLAGELRFITNQFNSKLAEVLDAQLDVNIHTNQGEFLEGHGALIGNVEVSYRTPRKYY